VSKAALPITPAFLSGGGQMGALMRTHDWTQTPLGAPEGWPQPLRTALRLLLNTGHPMYIWWGPDLLCFYNDAYAQSIGPERHPGSLGKPARQVWDEIWPIIGPQIDQVMSGGGSTWQENALIPITRNGKLEDVYWTYSYGPIDDETAASGVGGVLVVCTETTATVLARATLEESEARYRDIADAARGEAQFRLLVKGVTDYAIYLLDPTGHVTNWNLGAQRIKGYLPDEIIGQHFSRFYTDEDRNARVPHRGLEEARREGRFETEGWRVRKDGTRFWAHVVIDAIPDDTGQIIGFAKITRDVTERQAAQVALEQAREALFHSQKMESIGQLTGGIAHDFNNLLMAVLGSLELVQKRLPDDPQVHRLINNAIQGAQRGAALTQRMLAFARRQELKREAVDLPALVHGMEDLLLRSVDPSIRIDIDFPETLAPIETDPAQLETALLNLVVNARDAMTGGGVMTITAAQASTTGNDQIGVERGTYVCLSVSDTGEGMDPETVARATEPFFTTKGVGKGTGLGLSMIHGLLSQSGGALEISSQVGRGTTVTLWLPIAAAAVAVRPAAASRALDDDDRAKLTVMAVDDDALVLLNTSAMLEELGHTVLKAEDAAGALAILRAGAVVDLLITDQAMPGMTGAGLARIVRSEWPDLAILLATGFAELTSDLDLQIPKLAKPFGQKELDQAIQQTMRAQSVVAARPPCNHIDAGALTSHDR
jgi:PAS domain S-box-containing protein